MTTTAPKKSPNIGAIVIITIAPMFGLFLGAVVVMAAPH